MIAMATVSAVIRVALNEILVRAFIVALALG
jgi:hypothetical protein